MDWQRLRKPLIGAGIAVFLLVLGLLAYQVFSHPPDRPFYIPISGGDEGELAVSRKLGFNICKALLDNGQATIMIRDPESSTPKLTLIISESGRWARFSKSSQRDICNYIKYTVAEAKVLVSQYIPNGRANPRYNVIAENVQRNLCDTCWMVMENDTYLVADDKAWLSLPDPARVTTWKDFQAALTSR